MKDNEAKKSFNDSVNVTITEKKTPERFNFKEFLNDLRMEQQETM